MCDDELEYAELHDRYEEAVEAFQVAADRKETAAQLFDQNDPILLRFRAESAEAGLLVLTFAMALVENRCRLRLDRIEAALADDPNADPFGLNLPTRFDVDNN